VSRLSSWRGLVVALLVLLSQAESYGAVPAAENLLPSTTKGFLSVASVDQLRDSWNKTQLGQLMADPTMKPFIEDFRLQIQQKWTQTHQKLGITWDDLDGVPAGEIAVAMILPSATEVAFAITVDVTGHQEQASALLEKINKNMIGKKAVQTTRNVQGATVNVFDIPQREDIPARQVVYFVKDDLLAASDNLKVIEGILARQAQVNTDSLATLPAFEAITKRCSTAAGALAPHARWFVEPFGYADAVRLASEQPRRKGTDMLKILRGEGFTAIQGIGGFINFSADPYEVLHRTLVFAPGNTAGGERFTLAARMLEFPNGENFAPPNWVPRDVASYASLNLNVKNAFESSKTLVNEIVGDEVFEDVLESIRTDENGPKIDIRRDVIALLGNRITIISDLQLPITPKSERLLVAVETTNEKHLAEVIKNWMETDPDTKRREINGHVVWEIVDEKAELPMVTIENSPLSVGGGGADEEPAEKPLLPNSAVTVAFGQLFVATHIDILTKVLTEAGNREKLDYSADYARVQAEMARLAQPQQFAQTFTRTDDAFRGVYELLRTGRMPEAESMVGKLLNALMGEGKEGVLRTQRIDGSKLPEYDLVRRYLGPAGTTMTTEANGWFLTGFLLTKEAPLKATLETAPAAQ
jgi:hypothetical protein